MIKKWSIDLMRTMRKKQWFIWGLLTIVGICIELCAVATKLEFLQAQKSVQSGDTTKWELYLILLVSTQVLGLFQEVHEIFYRETAKRYVHTNLISRYQEFGRLHEHGILLLSNMISSEIQIPLSVIAVAIGFWGMKRNVQMLSDGAFAEREILVAILLFVLTIVCGAARGILDSREEEIDAKLSVNRNDCLKFQLFSEHYKNRVAMKRVDQDWIKKTWQRAGKEFLRYFPGVLKQSFFLALVWGMVNTHSGIILYSESYLLLSALETVLKIAEGIGRIISKILEINQMRKNPNVKGLRETVARREDLLKQNENFIQFESGKLTILEGISIPVRVANRMHYYKLSKQIIVSQGQHVIITGEKKTGKTRLLNVVASLFYKVVLIYSTNSKILGRLGDNFTVSNPKDFDLIRELAAGLKLLDLENLPDAQIEDWHMGDINTGDKNLLTVLIMLYMGIKEPEKARIMIFDEVLANIDDRNSKEIIEFIIKKVDAIGATAIFVAHEQKDLIRKYCKFELEFNRSEDWIFVTQCELRK